MGTVTVTIQVGDLQGHQFEELDIIVDTGSTYTAVPRAMLERLGVPIQRSMSSQTADGRIVPVDIGQTIVRLEGFEFYTPVIFAAENEPSFLGAVTLEEAGLAVDPVNGRLIPHTPAPLLTAPGTSKTPAQEPFCGPAINLSTGS